MARMRLKCEQGKVALRLFVLVFLGGAFSGCGASGPRPVKVTGSVTYNGKATAVIVTFVPAEGTNVPSATGNCDEAGRFELRSVEGKGAYPGRYRVAILPVDPPPEFEMPGAKKYVPPFPEKYSSPKTSGFSVEVKQETDNDFDFAMGD